MRVANALLALSCLCRAFLPTRCMTPPPLNGTAALTPPPTTPPNDKIAVHRHDERRLADRYRTLSVGVLPGWRNVWAREHDYGLSFDRILFFADIKKLNYEWCRNYLSAGYKVTLVLEFFADYANLDSIGDGDYDYHIDRIARAVRDDGRQITIRTLHEINASIWACIACIEFIAVSRSTPVPYILTFIHVSCSSHNRATGTRGAR